MQRMTIISALFAGLAFFCLTYQTAAASPATSAQPTQQATSLPPSVEARVAAMADLMKRLQGPIRKLQPKATIWMTGGDRGITTFRAQYQTRQFLVYDRSMTGKIASKPDEVEGPNYQGFLLWVSSLPYPYAGQEVPNQTVQEPYWSTYFNIYEIKHPHEYLVVNLSYGVRTDPTLIAQIKQIVADYAAKR